MRLPKNEITNDQIVLRIMEVLKAQKKTEKELVEYIGLANGTFTKWKYKNVKSYQHHMDKISEFLNVSQTYLTDGIDDIINVHSLSASEVHLLQMYRKMGKEEREVLMKSASWFVDSLENRRK